MDPRIYPIARACVCVLDGSGDGLAGLYCLRCDQAACATLWKYRCKILPRRSDARGGDRSDAFGFVASPNNPTGIANTKAELLELAHSPEHVILCLDEAYAEYVEQAIDLRAAIREGRKVICMRTSPKSMGSEACVWAMPMPTLS